ncbi:hypothetical protein DPMN_127093 [Dreissena polymorpha]|uniref:Uncharacterized protein n=1 Tax=Dreissena polymorpha TaxID=45954 RepID=A0A9D4GX98_DREPO|nr:hypothetical protein DPMN_127093 [Dreissena polymorpha]
MRDDDTEILLQSGLLYDAVSNLSMGRDSILYHYPSKFPSERLDVDLPLRVKRPGLAAVEKDRDYEGLVEPVLGGEANGTACS